MSPEDRLEILWGECEKTTGRSTGQPPSDHERLGVEQWLRQNNAQALWLNRFGVYKTLREKAGLVVQQACGACERLPYAPVFNRVVWHEPWSHQTDQARSNKIKQQIQQKLTPTASEWAAHVDLPVCLSVVAIQSEKTKAKDADNVVKGLLDALEKVLYANDRQVQCLTSRRFQTAAPFGYYLVNATFVRPWMADVVLDDPREPTINAHKIEVD